MRRLLWMRRNVSFLAAVEEPLPVETIAIACDEVQEFPDLERTPRLGNIAVVRTPANVVFDTEGEVESRLPDVIETLLEETDIKYIVIRAHTNCGYIQSLVRGEVPSHASNFASLSSTANNRLCNDYANFPADQRMALYVQHHVTEQFDALISCPKVGRMVSQGHLKILGWIYDHEMDWISLLDSETGLFVPINAHSEMNDRPPPLLMPS